MVDPSGTFEFYDFAAGWFSGICGLLVGHPFDTVKVRQQTQGNRGAAAVILKIVKEEGPYGFYKGLLMPLMTQGVLNSVFFGFYGNSVRFFAFLRDERPKRTCCDSIHTRPTYKNFHWDIFWAGCTAGAITTIGACPFELSKIKLQVQHEHLKFCKMEKHSREIYSGSYDCLVKLYKAGGIKFIYKGLVPMLWRDVPTFGIYTLVYEHTLCLCEYNTRYHAYAPFCVMLGGCMAGIFAWAFIMPIDVIKSRIQADDHFKPKYNGMIDCFRKTYKKYGPSFLMRGFFVTIARAIPVNAATFCGYEGVIYLYLGYFSPETDD